MPKAKVSELFHLIKSMDKAEKRNFKIFAQRSQKASSTKFMRLFDLVDKMKVYDETAIRYKLGPTQRFSTEQLQKAFVQGHSQILKDDP